jgi:ApaG protein
VSDAAIRMIFPHDATTRIDGGSITVRVAPRFLPDQSDPEAPRYVWSYHVRIENHADQTVQLRARSWLITDGDGHVEAIDGPGVIGQQPVIEPGGAFDYVSGCPLETPSGSMQGHYLMTGREGSFQVTIPLFPLRLPRQ